MDIKKLSNEFAVASQITLADVQTIYTLGYQSIVCHRSDGESLDQIHFSEIKSAANKLGIDAIYQPVVSGNVNDEDVLTFKNIMLTARFPMLAYCRTGTRCTELWSRAKLEKRK